MTCRASAKAFIQTTMPTLLAPGSSLGALKVYTLTPSFYWDGSPGTSSYTLQIETAAGVPVLEAEVGNVERTVLPIPLEDGVTYRWRVAARRLDDIQTSFTNWYLFLVELPVVRLDAPILTYPTDGEVVTTVTPILTWEPVLGAVTYEIEIALDVDFANLFSTHLGVVGSSLTVYGLTPGSTYFWRMRAFDDENGLSLHSSVYSFSVHVLPGIAEPLSSIESVLVDRFNLVLAWLMGDNATRYFVRVATDSAFESLVFFNVVASTTVRLPPMPADKYYWSIQSINASGYSAWTSFEAFNAV